MTAAPPSEMQRSSRDRGALRGRLERWLHARLPAAVQPRIEALSSPSASGMSSETLLFDATWREGAGERRGTFVARLAPDPGDVPVFPSYDLPAQFRLLERIAARGRVPVPPVHWLEPDPGPLGVPFFVMERVEGRVPPDVMPYNLGSWVSEASPAERRAMQEATVAILAALHAIDASGGDFDFLALDLPGETPLQRHVEGQRRYYDWVRGERRHPLIERAFDWLGAHWPEREGEAVVSWGDSRIGNVIYRGFEPVAALDWEMAALGPRELDLGWLVFMHTFFEDIAAQLGRPGLPDFLRGDDVVARYEAVTGHRVRDFAFYEAYAALRHAIIMTRIHARRVHFGEADWPADPDETIPHRRVLERMIGGAPPA